MNLCQFQDVLGKPKEGIHKLRIGLFNAGETPNGLAFWDLFATALFAGLLSYQFDSNWLLMFVILLVIAVSLHRLFCVKTTLNEFLGFVPDDKKS